MNKKQNFILEYYHIIFEKKCQDEDGLIFHFNL